MDKKRTLIGLSTTAVILLSLLSSFVVMPVSAADPSGWYTTVPGVLTSDYYTLYPFLTQSVDFGLSKFGEMVDYPVAAGIGVGLQYPGYDKIGTYSQKLTTEARDPFCNEYIDPKLWINGWFIEIRYTHKTLRDRRVLAMALFADMMGYGGDWIVGHSPKLTLAPHGGRKTTGYAETEELAVLYNGPRLYVAQSLTHIYDWFDSDEDGEVDHPDETWQIVDLRLTFVFEKVKKQVIIFKDVKQIITGKELASPLDIQLSNREEWDLGKAPSFGSYAHFFHQVPFTCYGTAWFSEYPDYMSSWHTAPGILREFIVSGYNITSVPVTTWSEDGVLWVGPIAEGSVRVYVNGEFKEEGIDYDINYDTGAITWHIAIDPKEDWIEVIYKLWKAEMMWGLAEQVDGGDSLPPAIVGVPHCYDVAQIISNDVKFVGWKAFWPTLSDYTVDGWAKAFIPLINVSQADMVPATKEPNDMPLVVGEWDFMLGKGYPESFRGVEVVGLSDYHNADDPQLYGDEWLDCEAVYQLSQVFEPWSLFDAVWKKNTWRWVEFFTGTGDVEYEFDGEKIGWWLDLENLVPMPGYYDEPWDAYCTFRERVLVNGKLIWPSDAIRFNPDLGGWYCWPSFPYTYEIDFENGIIWFYKDSDGKKSTDWGFVKWAPPEDSVIKVLYSTFNPLDLGPYAFGRYEWIVVGRESETVDSAGASMVSAAFKDKILEGVYYWETWNMGAEIGLAGEDMEAKEVWNSMPWVMRKFGTSNDWGDYLDDPFKRAALNDDWCKTWPVASSNMIGVGGPLKNLLAYYGNDFTSAFFGLPEYACDEWDNKIIALSCWGMNTYESTEEKGYAVISTFKDLNGTVVFLVWGHWGRDTYYATQFFKEEEIYEFQIPPFCCATSVIIEIDYADPKHPTFSVVEVLGTISERQFAKLDKGGIHDC